MKKTIVMTDIVGSSKLWNMHFEHMMKILDEIYKKVLYLCLKYDGFLIKTIGDAFMISFSKLKSGILFSIDLQDYLRNTLFKIKKQSIQVQMRIGIGFGTVEEKKWKIQNTFLKDFFGKTVNIASRMESKVSPVSGFGLYIENNDKKEFQSILPILHKNAKEINKILYKDECNSNTSFKKNEEIFQRSMRLIPSKIYCKNMDELKGVGSLVCYQIFL